LTIRAGQPWGETGQLPADAVVVANDAAAAAAIEDARRGRRALPALGLAGGDLCRTLGGRGDEARLRSGPATIVPVDLGEVLIDGRLHRFVAHLVVRRGWWRGPVTAVMNAQYLGRWDVAPRAHPNDGLLDVVEVDAAMGVGQRWMAWRRLPAGGHVPHPGITVRRVAAVQLDAAGRHVWIDGVDAGPARALSVRVEPDALTCAV
jgi:hypothetical protein